MAAPISLRVDFDGPMLRAFVLAGKAGSVTRRLLSRVRIMTAVRGRGAADHSRLVLRFNLRGPDGASDGKSTGASLKAQRRPEARARRHGRGHCNPGGPQGRALEVDRSGAMGVQRYGRSVTKQILSRERARWAIEKLSARPRHYSHEEAASSPLELERDSSPPGRYRGRQRQAR